MVCAAEAIADNGTGDKLLFLREGPLYQPAVYVWLHDSGDLIVLAQNFSKPASYPAEPLASFQINRQLSGWIPPPLVIRAFGAHGQQRTLRPPKRRGFRGTFTSQFR